VEVTSPTLAVGCGWRLLILGSQKAGMTDGLCWWQGSTETNTSVRAAALGVDRHSIASPRVSRETRNVAMRNASC
jgi:hypothetical protein